VRSLGREKFLDAIGVRLLRHGDSFAAGPVSVSYQMAASTSANSEGFPYDAARGRLFEGVMARLSEGQDNARGI
jgi:hypothetical protein